MSNLDLVAELRGYAHFGLADATLKGMAADEIVTLRAQVDRLTKDRDDLLGYKKYWKEWLNLQSGDARKIGERAEQADELEKQLAALAEQVGKMRKVLPHCVVGASGYAVEQLFIECLSLPNLASPVLNRIRAEGMEEAAEIANGHVGVAWAVSAIRARADELRKNHGN